MGETLYTRTVSGFPLSISTGLAFESLFPPRQSVYDPERVKPEMIDIGDYQQFWINVDTLFRNMIQSADKNAVTNTGYKEAASVLADEMDTIVSLLNNEGQGTTSPVFYVCDYKHALRNLHKAISLRKDTTAKQLHYTNLRDKTMKYLKESRSDIKFFPGTIRTSNNINGLMLTHLPIDLLANRFFGRLDLLESNTGKLKKKHQWNTKYYPVPGKNMNILPFNRMLLMVLGDKPMIQPSPSKLRNQIMDVAEKRKWTPATTKDKCHLDLSLELHPYDMAVLNGAGMEF